MLFVGSDACPACDYSRSAPLEWPNRMRRAEILAERGVRGDGSRSQVSHQGSALDLVDAPVSAMRVNSAISMTLCVVSAGVWFFRTNGPLSGYRALVEASDPKVLPDVVDEWMTSMFWAAAYHALLMFPFFLGSALTYVAAGRMRLLRSYRLVQAGILVSLIPAFVHWCNWPFAVGVGVWALRTLSKPKVARAFALRR